MKSTIAAILLTTVAAFTPEKKGRVSTVIKSYENEVGAVLPTGAMCDSSRQSQKTMDFPASVSNLTASLT